MDRYSFLNMLMVIGLVAAILIPEHSIGSEPSDMRIIKKLFFEEGVTLPTRLLSYKRTEYTQRVAITNEFYTNFPYHQDRDDIWVNAPPSLNPNRLFPWKVNGGLHKSSGWESRLFVAFPNNDWVWVWNGQTPNGQTLPKIRWQFPTQTVFIDLLTKNGKPFELRTLTKTKEGWIGRTTWENEHKPDGYISPHKVRITDAPHVREAGVNDNPSAKCLNCHTHAGSSLQYGISLRGDDHNFSWSPLKEGVVEVDQKLLNAGVVKWWNGQP